MPRLYDVFAIEQPDGSWIFTSWGGVSFDKIIELFGSDPMADVAVLPLGSTSPVMTSTMREHVRQLQGAIAEAEKNGGRLVGEGDSR